MRLDGRAGSHTVEGMGGYTKGFGLYPVSGVETLKGKRVKNTLI